MDLLRKIFPLSFKEKKDVAALIINVLIQLVIGIVLGWIIGIVVLIPIIGLLVALVGGLVDLYFFVGIILSILDYFKVLK